MARLALILMLAACMPTGGNNGGDGAGSGNA